MKKLVVLLSVALVAATVPLAHAATSPAKAPAKASMSAGKSHAVEAEVVSANVAKRTITFKADGADKTAPVDRKAVASLRTVKAGDKVTLTCWDNAKGEHVRVTAIAPAKATASK
jgi:hypothetical protein